MQQSCCKVFLFEFVPNSFDSHLSFLAKLFELLGKTVIRHLLYLCIKIQDMDMMNDIFSKDLSGEMVSPNESGYDMLIDEIFRTMEKAQELATVSIRDQKRVHELMGEILDKHLPDSTFVLPPLYIDYGKPVTIGERCFIQQCCTFFGRGGIDIGNDVFIGPKVNLITINHDVNPNNRSATYGRRIVIEDKVWIGINSTILPGVRIGYGAIVGAGSVVTKDVEPMTVVAGNPARFIKKIEANDK